MTNEKPEIQKVIDDLTIALSEYKIAVYESIIASNQRIIEELMEKLEKIEIKEAKYIRLIMDDDNYDKIILGKREGK